MKGANNPQNPPIDQRRWRVVTSLALARTEFHVIGLHVCQLPPEANADADGATADIMPPSHWDVQRLASLKDAFNVRNIANARIYCIPVFCGGQLHFSDVDCRSVGHVDQMLLSFLFGRGCAPIQESSCQ